MANVYTAALSQLVIREQGTLNVSLINLIAEIRVSALPLPGGIFRCFLAFEMEAADNEHLRARAVPVDPNGVDQVEAAEELDTQTASARHQWFFQLSRWIVNLPGTWHLRFDLFEGGTWRRRGSIPLTVSVLPAPEA